MLSGDRIVAERSESMARGQAERLMPLVESLLAEANAEWASLTRLGVGIGPGNFTGIRIAVAAARGLALGLGIPAIGVTIFDAMASTADNPDEIRIPAGRGLHYAMSSGSVGDPALSEGDVPPLDAAGLVRAIARIAALRALPQPRPAPLYLRPADAAPPRDAPPRIHDA
ncbi:protease, putative [Oceaniovalibus guishaninsula JLT2003]|uniref:Protease, putative n=1 Tax=Oceaniovalibus guishaninsula JLT2003 TaxID=1231392 RepID=K2H8C0_9RHOB|nr:protease, putative [Oceaniovalibus guishaninsula JLT2003]